MTWRNDITTAYKVFTTAYKEFTLEDNNVCSVYTYVSTTYNDT